MKLLVQWARSQPGGWEEVEASQWRHLPKRPDPTGQPHGVDHRPGWIAQVNIQGLVPTADHYAVEHVDDETLRLTLWFDDPSYVTDGYYAVVWTIKTLAPDPKHGGAINTRQSAVVYAEGDAYDRFANKSGGGWPDVRPWSEFVPPAEEHVRHGKQLSDEQWEAHQQATPLRGWRHFTEGLPPEEIIDGKVPVQRNHHSGEKRYKVPEGTKYCYGSDTASATDIHAATNEVAFLTGTGSPADLNALVGKGASVLIACFTSPAGFPNDADWPSGVYGFTLDVTANAYSVLGMLTVGTVDGHFARVNAALSSDLQTWTQAESAFSGTGLFAATTGTIDPSAGSASDRFECLVGAYTSGTKNGSVTLQVNESDDQAYGPWTGILPTTAVSETAISVSDTTSTQKTASALVRTADDSITITDTTIRGADYLRKPTADSVTVTDTTLRVKESWRPIQDTVSVTDALSRGKDSERTIGNSIDVADAIARELALSRTPAVDALTGTDLVVRDVYSCRGYDASLSVSDSLAATRYGLNRVTQDDSVSVSDDLLREKETAKTVTDTVDVSDSAVRELAIGGDTYLRTADDSLTVTDLLVKTADCRKVLADTADVTDGTVRTKQADRTQADSVAVSDITLKTYEGLRALSDAESVTDQLTHGTELVRELTDTIAVSDVLARVAECYRELSDTASATDQTSTVKEGGTPERTANDSISVSDVALRTVGTEDEASQDSVDVADLNVRSATYSRTIDDWRGRSYP